MVATEYPLIVCTVLAAAVGAAVTYILLKQEQQKEDLRAKRQRLPKTIILLRHGESEGNADHTLYRTMPDNMIPLTANGVNQAREAGKRIKEMVGDAMLDVYVSPFERTIQTLRAVRESLGEQIRITHVEPLIREQEFGNLQGDEFKSYRNEQKKAGRFWYRFPTGESGADVFSRVRQWWDSSIRRHNINFMEPTDTVLVVTHGLTMRFVLMQQFGWSPATFHSVWNAENCQVYVLRLDDEANLSLEERERVAFCPAKSTDDGHGDHCDNESRLLTFMPYVLDKVAGDTPESSIEVDVTYVRGGDEECTCTLTLRDYLTLPQPRTLQLHLVKDMIEAQNDGIPAESIVSVEAHRAGGRTKKVTVGHTGAAANLRGVERIKRWTTFG